MIGVMVLIIAMAIMNGMGNEFKTRLFTMNYPLTVVSLLNDTIDNRLIQKLENNNLNLNLKLSPYINTQAVLQDNGNLNPISIYGVDFNREIEINSILKENIDINLQKISKFDLIIGETLKDNIGIELNSKVTLMFSKIDSYGFSNMPKLKRFKIKEIFSSGLHSYDNSLAYTTLDGLRAVLNIPKDNYTGVHIYSDNPFDDIEKIKKLVGVEYQVIGWWQQNGNFFSALELEKTALFIVLMLIVLVASLNIISSSLMTVMNRRKEIALLLSLGSSKTEIKKIFLYLGLIIGGFGLISGVILGFIGIYLLGNFDIITLPADVYSSSKLPLDLDIKDLLLIIFGSSAIIFLSAYYPAYRVTKIDSLTVLRSE